MKNSLYTFFKRFFDITFSLTLLTLLSPLILLISILIKLTSKGPVFYASERIGKNYRPFICYKFRTMVIEADKNLDKLLAHDEQKRAEWEQFMKLKDDPRITPIGHFLRKSSLDELPQFINVLKNDLSIVGPRPLAIAPHRDVKETIRSFLGPESDLILSIKPGITGLWQTSGRSSIPLKKRRQIEAYYVRKQSFFLDIFLIAKTLPAVIFSKGAF